MQKNAADLSFIFFLHCDDTCFQFLTEVFEFDSFLVTESITVIVTENVITVTITEKFNIT